MESQDNQYNNFNFQLLEKDKIIFEYTKNIKDLERKLDVFKKQAYSKDDSIIALKDEIKELNFKLKSSENALQKKDELINKLRYSYEDKISILGENNKFLEDKVNELNRINENNQIERQSLLLEIKKIEKCHQKYKQNDSERTENIKFLENTIEEQRKEIKSLLIFKKKSQEQENSLNSLKLQLENERKDNNQFSKEKDEIEKQVQQLLRDNKICKELSVINNKLNSELNSLKNDINRVNSENENFMKSSNERIKEFDIFYNTINSQLNHLCDYIENIENFSETNSFNFNVKIDKRLFSKYELLIRLLDNIKLISKNKIITKNESIIKLNNKISCLEQENKGINEENSNIKKKLISADYEINDYIEKNTKLNKSLEESISSNKHLSDKIDKLDVKQTDLSQKINNLEFEYFALLNDLSSKFLIKVTLNYSNQIIKPKLQKNVNSNIRTSPDTSEYKIEKDYYQIINPSMVVKQLFKSIDSHFEKMNLLTKAEQELKDLNNKNSEVISELNQEINSLKYKLEEELCERNIEIKNIKEEAIYEATDMKENLLDKIKSLTSIIEDGNKMILILEKDNNDLKRINLKQERSLKLLTDSHIELEKCIENNYETLKIQLDNKENEFSVLNRDLELKSLHISSLENILKRKDEQYTNPNIELSYNYNNISNNKLPSRLIPSFINEKEEDVKLDNKTNIFKKITNEVFQYKPYSSNLNTSENQIDHNSIPNFSCNNYLYSQTDIENNKNTPDFHDAPNYISDYESFKSKGGKGMAKIISKNK